jgi:hypothetical protein
LQEIQKIRMQNGFAQDVDDDDETKAIWLI